MENSLVTSVVIKGSSPMLVTKQPIFRRFWYPVVPMSQLATTLCSFTLLGERMVLWLDSWGKPVAAQDRCCHRSAQLSLGRVIHGTIACPYHGWQFDGTGACIHVPQLQKGTIPGTSRICVYECRERYGYAWVCLEEPIADIPNITEALSSDFRLIHEFYETWNCAGLRVMENELDLAHPTFVHPSTFGSADHPTPDRLEITETPEGLHARGILGVVNPELQQQNLKMNSAQTYRTLDMVWFMPFTVKLRIGYPNGLVHIIVNTMTPISDGTSQMVQFCLRNDSESETPSRDVIAFDRAVTLEDKRILETTDYDVPLISSREQHIFTDKPGLLMRKKIAALLKEYGETEQTAA
ncbi:MAG: Rieske 2Fe-2S domain-containing protein [Synechococcales cyanobacterium]